MRSFMQERDFPEKRPGNGEANAARWGCGGEGLRFLLLPAMGASGIPPQRRSRTDRQDVGSVGVARAAFHRRLCKGRLLAIPSVSHQLLQLPTTRTPRTRNQSPVLRAGLIHLFSHPNRSVPGLHGSSSADHRSVWPYGLTRTAERSGPRRVRLRPEPHD